MNHLMTRPYFYIIEHIKSGMRYAGSRWAKNCNPEELLQQTGYHTNSRKVKSVIEQEGLDSFKIVSIEEMANPLEFETAFLRENQCSTSEHWFNCHNNNFLEHGHLSIGSEEFKSIMLKRYGCEHPMHKDEFKKKQKKREIETLSERYGVSHNTHIPGAREKLSKKIKESGRMVGENNPCFGLFGADHPAYGTRRSEEIREKMRENCGRWERTQQHCEDISERQRRDSVFVKNNPMNDPEKRKLVSASKVGRRKYISADGKTTRMCFPGTEPAGFIPNKKV